MLISYVDITNFIKFCSATFSNYGALCFLLLPHIIWVNSSASLCHDSLFSISRRLLHSKSCETFKTSHVRQHHNQRNSMHHKQPNNMHPNQSNNMHHIQPDNYFFIAFRNPPMVCDLVLFPIVLMGSISGPFLSWAPCTLAGGTYCKTSFPAR